MRRSDVFARGVLVHELLSGAHPAGTLPDGLKRRRMAKHLRRQYKRGVPSFARVCPDLEPPVAAVLDRCLALSVRTSFRRRVGRHLEATIQSPAPCASPLSVASAPQFRADRFRSRRPFTGRISLGVCADHQRAPLCAGMAAYHRGDFEEAEERFGLASRSEPNSKRYRFARGCARLQLDKECPGDKDRLDSILDDLILDSRGLTTPSNQAILGYVHIRRQNFCAAIDLYDQIIDTEYRPTMALNNRAFCCISLKRYKEAKEDLGRAEELDPNCQAVNYNRAKLAIAMRLQNKALLVTSHDLKCIEKAMQEGPRTTALFSDAALLYKFAAQDEYRRTPISLDAPIIPALHLLSRQTTLDRALFFQTRINPWGQSANLPYQTSGSTPQMGSLSASAKTRFPAPFLELTKREIRLLDPVELVDSPEMP